MESHPRWEYIAEGLPRIVNFFSAVFSVDYPCRVCNLSRIDAEPLPSERFLIGHLFKGLEASEAPDPDEGYALDRGPSVFLAVLGGTLLRLWRRSLSPWSVNAVPVHEPSESIYALTRGRNSRNIIVIVGNGYCPKPKDVRSWERLRRPSPMWRAGCRWGFIATMVTYTSLSLIWMFSLAVIFMSVDALSLLSLLAVGAIRVSYNAWLAMLECTPAMLNISLRKLEEIVSDDAMDVLMDFEATYEKARPLLREFFPDGPRSEAERRWWEYDETVEYDTERDKTPRRGRPRRLYPHSFPRAVYHPKHGKLL
ncbi:hypothetical protein PG997_008966 [Apiospora hydei]|uniref:Uncharacterized protein n=1 Tax=Apiospora hydei TaxID=1337664 RepID=A0ABR1WCB0_9PEZI